MDGKGGIFVFRGRLYLVGFGALLGLVSCWSLGHAESAAAHQRKVSRWPPPGTDPTHMEPRWEWRQDGRWT